MTFFLVISAIYVLLVLVAIVFIRASDKPAPKQEYEWRDGTDE